LNVKKALMITDSNQALFAKKSSCRLQEESEPERFWKELRSHPYFPFSNALFVGILIAS
jgi:hypothetical protein